ncbi:MAG: helix-turn-helix domain-containing protein [Acidobacteria bacterium]|nr:helix-turn-helix domain-containing protein [Acidobacteriota bacterium]
MAYSMGRCTVTGGEDVTHAAQPLDRHGRDRVLGSMEARGMAPGDWPSVGSSAVHPRGVRGGPRRSARVLSTAEREDISRGLAAQIPYRVIAERLGRAPSTISREVARHGGGAAYRATAPTVLPWSRTSRTTPSLNSSENCRRGRRPLDRSAIRDIVSTFRNMSTGSDHAQLERG